jgi:hypothetical protein
LDRAANFSKKIWPQFPSREYEGVFDMTGQINGHAIFENVRRYRGIASLYRQTAAFRPGQRWSLLEQAHEWEARALSELEAYFAARADHAQLAA